MARQCPRPLDIGEWSVGVPEQAGHDGHWSHEIVLLRLSTIDGMARIAIEDDGPGFPHEDRDLFLTWGRAPGSRSRGHGIGPPYVNSLTRGYGGGLSITDSTRLGGAMIVLDLSISAASPAVQQGKRATDPRRAG